MRLLLQFLFAFFWVGLVACGGGGEAELVVYRDDSVLVVDGREYERRTQEEIKGDFSGNVMFESLNLLGKSGVEGVDIERRLREYGLMSYQLDCDFLVGEKRCIVQRIAVPPDWGDQWARAMADWAWVEKDGVWFETFGTHEQ